MRSLVCTNVTESNDCLRLADGIVACGQILIALRTASLLSAVLVGLHLEKFADNSGKDHVILLCGIWEAAKLIVASACYATILVGYLVVETTFIGGDLFHWKSKVTLYHLEL